MRSWWFYALISLIGSRLSAQVALPYELARQAEGLLNRVGVVWLYERCDTTGLALLQGVEIHRVYILEVPAYEDSLGEFYPRYELNFEVFDAAFKRRRYRSALNRLFIRGEAGRLEALSEVLGYALRLDCP